MDSYSQENLIDRIKQSIDIVEVLSDYVPLKKAGQNYKGLCPFHSEKTPSFIVSPSKQLYHCFGCGVGGDVVNFLIRYENLSFLEAIRVIAKKAGIKIEPRLRGEDKELNALREALLKVNREAEDYFYRTLIGPSGKVAREYLFKRGIKEKGINDFKLGFSLPAWEGLLTTLGSKGYSHELLEKAGLVVARGGGKGHYDRFRGRIIFPIHNIGGDVIGFGGRLLDAPASRGMSGLPKYLNSPETLLYSKGENLYLLNKAKDYIRKEGFLILVEGYMDAIALHQSGIQNSVATLGTALTKGHLKAIKRFTNKVIVVFDADPAGERAALMGLDIFLEGGMELRVISLPSMDDPDSFIMREGRDKFLNLIHDASNLIDFSLRQVLRPQSQDSIERIRQVGEALNIISKIPNSIERGYYIKKLAEEIGINESFIIEEFRKLKSSKKIQGSGFRVQSLLSQGSEFRPKEEEILIHIMLKDKGVASEIMGVLSPEDFTYPPLKTLAKAIQSSLKMAQDIQLPSHDSQTLTIEKFLNPEDREAFSLLSELSLREIEYDDLRRVIEDCLLYINQRDKKKRLAELQLRIKDAELRGEEEAIPALLSEKQRLAKSESLK